jgi:hypothetical protein
MASPPLIAFLSFKRLDAAVAWPLVLTASISIANVLLFKQLGWLSKPNPSKPDDVVKRQRFH